MFHPQWREQALAGLSRPFDLVVLGGGITGCGVFFDAAQRGLRALLVEQRDIASGTSSRSSKLIHGGLRYLKHMQFRVTRMSCRERDRQLALHPHLVTPLPWIYPSYEGDRTPGWKVELGLRIHDRLSDWPEKYRRLDRDDLERLVPDLPREQLRRALAYHDGRVDDARLTLAVASSGLAQGGVALTRMEMEEGVRDADGTLRGLRLRDSLSGVVYTVDAPLVVNATGTWVDRVRHRLGLESSTVRPSRGSHLMFGADALPLDAAVTVMSPGDGRPVFFVPHPEGVLVGTTDLFHHGDLDDPRPTQNEVDYLLRAVRATFPGRNVTADDIRGCFAGVRPVLQNHAESPSAASREEAIWFERGLLSVAGGKLTTWRATAEAVVDEAIRHLPPERTGQLRPCATFGTPLAGLAPMDLPDRLVSGFDLEPTVAQAMTRRLGHLAWLACEMAKDGAELRPLTPDVDLTAAEVRCHVRYGGVLHLRDLLLRRVRLGMWHPALADDLLPHLRRPMRRALGWSRARWDDEVESYLHAAEGWAPRGIRAADDSAADDPVGSKPSPRRAHR